MSKPSLALVVMSAFSSIERANEIEGDLLELARENTALWYRFHLFVIVMNLIAQAVRKSPWPPIVLGLVLLVPAYGALIMAELMSTGTLGVILVSDNGISGYSALILLLSLSALPIMYLSGVILVRFAPNLGPKTIPVVIAMFAIALALLQATAHPADLMPDKMLMFLFLSLPLLVAGFRTHRTALSLNTST